MKVKGIRGIDDQIFIAVKQNNEALIYIILYLLNNDKKQLIEALNIITMKEQEYFDKNFKQSEES